MFKKLTVIALFSILSGGCSLRLITMDVRGGLEVEAYEPVKVARHEYLPTYSWGGGGVYSNGSTEIWDGYGFRDGKVARVYENVYGGSPLKSIFGGKRK